MWCSYEYDLILILGQVDGLVQVNVEKTSERDRKLKVCRCVRDVYSRRQLCCLCSLCEFGQQLQQRKVTLAYNLFTLRNILTSRCDFVPHSHALTSPLTPPLAVDLTHHWTLDHNTSSADILIAMTSPSATATSVPLTPSTLPFNDVNMDTLPLELKQRICSFLTPKELKPLRLTSKIFAAAAGRYLIDRFILFNCPDSIATLGEIVRHEVFSKCITTLFATRLFSQ